jgi:hypothetical protein
MPKEYHSAPTGADGPNRVASGIDLSTKATRLHLTAELADSGTLMVGQARYLDQSSQQIDVSVIWQQGARCGCWCDFRR